MKGRTKKGSVSEMTSDKVFVTLGWLVAIAFMVWFFWMDKREDIKAGVTSSGYQEAMVLIKGGSTSDVIVVEHGKPARLNFRREETAS